MNNLKEDGAPFNNAGSGSIAGIGVGPNGEPPGPKSVITKLLRRKKPITEEPKVASLYVNRPLINSHDIITWAKEQGIKHTLQPKDFHVTIAYSTKHVDWSKIKPETTGLYVNAKETHLEVFQNKILVLRFNSPSLNDRWKELRNHGCSWDFPDYKSHITISYDFTGDYKHIKPFSGKLVFGPEEFAEIDENWKTKLKENTIGESFFANNKVNVVTESFFDECKMNKKKNIIFKGIEETTLLQNEVTGNFLFLKY